MSALLRLHQLKKSYDGEPVLHGIDLQVEHGEMVGLSGPSGSGKSTILNIVGCIDHSDSGEHRFDGTSLQNLNKGEKNAVRRAKIGFIFQHFHLIESMNVYQNIEFPLLLLNFSAKERRFMVEDVLERLNIASIKKQKTNQISGGQKQRVAIARALVKRPRLVIADEPTASLDQANSEAVFSVFTDLLTSLNACLIMASHDSFALERMHRVVHLKKGRIAQEQRKQIQNSEVLP